VSDGSVDEIARLLETELQPAADPLPHPAAELNHDDDRLQLENDLDNLETFGVKVTSPSESVDSDAVRMSPMEDELESTCVEERSTHPADIVDFPSSFEAVTCEFPVDRVILHGSENCQTRSESTAFEPSVSSHLPSDVAANSAAFNVATSVAPAVTTLCVSSALLDCRLPSEVPSLSVFSEEPRGVSVSESPVALEPLKCETMLEAVTIQRHDSASGVTTAASVEKCEPPKTEVETGAACESRVILPAQSAALTMENDHCYPCDVTAVALSSKSSRPEITVTTPSSVTSDVVVSDDMDKSEVPLSVDERRLQHVKTAPAVNPESISPQDSVFSESESPPPRCVVASELEVAAESTHARSGPMLQQPVVEFSQFQSALNMPGSTMPQSLIEPTQPKSMLHRSESPVPLPVVKIAVELTKPHSEEDLAKSVLLQSVVELTRPESVVGGSECTLAQSEAVDKNGESSEVGDVALKSAAVQSENLMPSRQHGDLENCDDALNVGMKYEPLKAGSFILSHQQDDCITCLSSPMPVPNNLTTHVVTVTAMSGSLADCKTPATLGSTNSPIQSNSLSPVSSMCTSLTPVYSSLMSMSNIVRTVSSTTTLSSSTVVFVISDANQMSSTVKGTSNTELSLPGSLNSPSGSVSSLPSVTAPIPIASSYDANFALSCITTVPCTVSSTVATMSSGAVPCAATSASLSTMFGNCSPVVQTSVSSNLVAEVVPEAELEPVTYKSVTSGSVLLSPPRTSVGLATSPPRFAIGLGRGSAMPLNDSMSDDELHIVLPDNDSFAVSEASATESSPKKGDRLAKPKSQPDHASSTVSVDAKPSVSVSSNNPFLLSANTDSSVQDSRGVENDTALESAVKKCTAVSQSNLAAVGSQFDVTEQLAGLNNDNSCINDIVAEMLLFRPLSPIPNCRHCDLCGGGDATTQVLQKRTITKRRLSDDEEPTSPDQVKNLSFLFGLICTFHCRKMLKTDNRTEQYVNCSQTQLNLYGHLILSIVSYNFSFSEVVFPLFC